MSSFMLPGAHTDFLGGCPMGPQSCWFWPYLGSAGDVGLGTSAGSRVGDFGSDAAVAVGCAVAGLWEASCVGAEWNPGTYS